MKIRLLIILLLVAVLESAAQAPQQINFQGVLRDMAGAALKNQQVTIVVSFVELDTDALRYRESHVVSSDNFGLIQLALGTGTPMTGNFQNIAWSQEQIVFAAAAMLPNATVIEINEQKFLSVPYALHANTATALSGANDTDVENELNQSISLNASVLTVTDAGGEVSIDLQSIDDQTLALDATLLSIQDGNQVDLAFLEDDADADPENELQDLQLSGSMLTLTNSDVEINLTSIGVDADDQTAEQVTYDGTAAQMDADQVQEAIDELAAEKVRNLQEAYAANPLITLNGTSEFQINTSAGAPLLTTNNSGMIGIGTITPDATLDVNSAALGVSAQLELSNLDGTHRLNLFSGSTSMDPLLSVFPGDALRLAHFNGVTLTERMRIASNGNIGIGTSTPDATLDVGSSGPDVSAQLEVSNSDGSHRLNFFSGRTSSPNPLISVFPGDALRLGHFNGVTLDERVRISADGNMGIGTTAPQGKMHTLGSTSNITGPFDAFETLVGNSLEAGAIFQFSRGSNQIITAGVASTIQGTGTNYALLGSSIGETGNLNRGVFGVAAGGDTENAGVMGVGLGNSPENIGLKGTAVGSTANYGAQVLGSGAGTSNYGIHANATGATTNYGVYASASGGTTNYAGYFTGNVNVQGQLLVNGTSAFPNGTYELGNNNISVGEYSLGSLTTGSSNIGIGFGTMNSATAGSNNVALGYRAMDFAVPGNNNIALGSLAQISATGSDNIAIGRLTMSNASGIGNIAVGSENLGNITTGEFNVALGSLNSRFITSGNNNIGIGTHSLDGATTGIHNVAIGYSSGSGIVSNTHNVALGSQSGILNNASRAVALGYLARAGQDDAIILGDVSNAAVRVGIGTSTPTAKLDVVGDIFVTGNVTATNIAAPSDRRLKTHIRPINDALMIISQLDGVSYTWKKDDPKNAVTQFGLIAQELEKVLPDLVQTKPDGYKTVNYVSLIPFLIESIKAQQSEIEKLKTEKSALQETMESKIDALTTLVKSFEASLNAKSQSTTSTDEKK